MLRRPMLRRSPRRARPPRSKQVRSEPAVPDDFLAVLKAHRRAPLKIYLGMAAGVGKTVAMLKEGKRLIAEGVDVAAAIVETHGRAATAIETQGIELIPRKTLIYRG